MDDVLVYDLTVTMGSKSLPYFAVLHAHLADGRKYTMHIPHLVSDSFRGKRSELMGVERAHLANNMAAIYGPVECRSVTTVKGDAGDKPESPLAVPEVCAAP